MAWAESSDFVSPVEMSTFSCLESYTECAGDTDVDDDDDYNDRFPHNDESDDCKPIYSPRSLGQINYQRRHWERFCMEYNMKSKKALELKSPLIYKNYIDWRYQKGRIKAGRTIENYWKQLRMLYEYEICKRMDREVSRQLNNFINRKTFDWELRTVVKEKTSIFVQDLAVLLSYHWIRDTEIFPHERLRVELATMLILGGPSAARPGSLIDIKYEDITLSLFPSKLGRPVLGMFVRQRNMKGPVGRKPSLNLPFREEPNLVYCPISYVLALAFADGALLADIRTLEQLYSIRIRPTEDRNTLLWKPEWRKQYVFRKMVGRSNNAAYTYNQAYSGFQRLGRSCGYAHDLTFYDIRRASGKALTEALTTEERNQLMGHAGGTSTVYRQYYMPDFVDTDIQAIYFGSVPQKDLIQQMSMIPRNELAPTRLNDEQKELVKTDPRLVGAIQKREECKAKIRDHYGTVNAARELCRPGQSAWLETYEAAARLVNSTRVKLERDALTSSIRTFHEQSGHEEIQRQLQGVVPDDTVPEVEVTYELTEREEVAKVLTEWSELLELSEMDRLRSKFISLLATLCHRQESTHHYRKTSRVNHEPTPTTPLAKYGEVSQVDNQAYQPRGGKTRRGTESPRKALACVFCQNDPHTGRIKQTRTYARIDSLGHHVFKQHFDAHGRPRRPLPGQSDAFACPYRACLRVLYGARDFAHHAHVLHGSPVFQEACIPGPAGKWVDLIL
ncbi:hypothetical protein F4679DRAFT_595032 [Xylaria curta]|nr:hypothetical protein F4679DRAFT_595032 [Xylaria curta]